MRGVAWISRRARGERVRGGAESARLVERLRTGSLCTHRCREKKPKQQGRRDQCAGPPHPCSGGSFGAQHAEHLLDLCCQLGGITESPRSVPRRAQPVAQTLHMIRDSALDARGS